MKIFDILGREIATIDDNGSRQYRIHGRQMEFLQAFILSSEAGKYSEVKCYYKVKIITYLLF